MHIFNMLLWFHFGLYLFQFFIFLTKLIIILHGEYQYYLKK